jgi:uncharacterized protein YjgD (DUF1641 family)
MAESSHIETFKELLAMSKVQSECITDGRTEDAVKILKEREALIACLKDGDVKLDLGDNLSRDLIKEITQNDERMMLVLTERRDSIAEKLKKRIETKKVISAYNETDKSR